MKISYPDFAVVQIVFTFGVYEKQAQDMNFEDRTYHTQRGRKR
jgi:hypothetical protein